ncbi:MAG: relaxase domain-containing protein, partial [Acidobacteriota bacterium]|nr:relaxase domain-containing protein [Acidobacteriota bacterium]
MGHRHRCAVLVLSKVRAGGHLYYLEPTGRTGGPAREPPGRWAGQGSAAWGLRGRVEPEALGALLEGADPRTGLPLGADRRQVTVAGYDLSFCAPKSVSVLHGLTEPDVRRAVGDAHDRAVSAALGYVEDHALAVRRRNDEGGRAVLPVEPAPAAVFLHRTSRADDPHLHSHVLVPNVGRGPEGDVSALDGRGVYAHRAATASLYHAQLRHELTAALGVAWGPLDRGRAEIAGIGTEVRRAFSRRSAAIAAHLADRGLAGPAGTSRRASTVAFFVTRPEKNLDVPVDDLRREWRRRGRELGLGPLRLEALLDRSPRRAARDVGREGTDQEIYRALVTVRPASSSFTRRDAVRAWAGTLPWGAPAADVERVADAFLARVGRSGAPGGRGRDPGGAGVAETRHGLPEDLGRAVADRGGDRREERRLLEALLARRGMALVADRALGRGVELG